MGRTLKTLTFLRGSSGKHKYLVLLHTEAPPDPDEWLLYLKELDGTFALTKGRVNTFVATDGGSPDDVQRRQLATVISRETRDALTHVFTMHASVRTVVTAFRWIAPPRAIAYQPREFVVVCEKCGIAAEDVLRDFAQAQAEFGPVKILADINAAVQAATQQDSAK
jgi:hypothetical protein